MATSAFFAEQIFCRGSDIFCGPLVAISGVRSVGGGELLSHLLKFPIENTELHICSITVVLISVTQLHSSILLCALTISVHRYVIAHESVGIYLQLPNSVIQFVYFNKIIFELRIIFDRMHSHFHLCKSDTKFKKW